MRRRREEGRENRRREKKEGEITFKEQKTYNSMSHQKTQPPIIYYD